MNIIQKITWLMGSFVFAGMANANVNPDTNPCDVQCVKKLMAQALAENPVMGSYTDATWSAACPGGNQGLLKGCLVNSGAAANSPIKHLIIQMFNSYNTQPFSAPNAVYIKKFLPGYNFALGFITFDGSAVSSSVQIACNPFLQTGINTEETIVNVPLSTFFAENDFLLTSTLLGGEIVQTNPAYFYSGPGTIPSNIPVYAVCIGMGTNGAPTSLSGVDVY